MRQEAAAHREFKLRVLQRECQCTWTKKSGTRCQGVPGLEGREEERGKREQGRGKGEGWARGAPHREDRRRRYSSVPVIQKLTVSAFMPIHWRAAAEVDMPSTLTQ